MSRDLPIVLSKKIMLICYLSPQVHMFPAQITVIDYCNLLYDNTLSIYKTIFRKYCF